MKLKISFLLLALISYTSAAVSCIGENGQPVDWWIILKYPKLEKNSNSNAVEGKAYSYADVNSPNLQTSSLTITDNSGALFSTVGQVFASSSTAYAIYNDETPTSTSYTDGHTKGVVGFDSESGFWLIHSVPKFPDANSLVYPDSGYEYGQSFLCITLDSAAFNTIGGQFLINKPDIYGSNLPDSLASSVPNFAAALNSQWIEGSATHIANLTSIGGVQFTSFAKNSDWDNELYEYLVQPYYSSDMYIETWQNGGSADDIPSFCTPDYPFDSMEVEYVTISSSYNWKTSKDHSKWAISTNQLYQGNIVCIGDINRQYSQYKRCGGTVCFSNASIWKNFDSFVTTAQSC